MRHEKAALVLELARRLASSAEGLTLDEMAAACGVGRRTAERMRDTLVVIFPQIEEIADGTAKRFRIPSGLDGFFQDPTAEELLELQTAIAALRAGGADARAKSLESLERKVRSAMRSSTLRRIVPDLEALVRAEAIAVQAGPRPFEDERLIAALREALMAMKAVRFRYTGGSRPGATRTVAPYGLMFGRANYLVAAELGSDAPRNWRLDRIEDLQLTDFAEAPPAEFDLTEYANRSFGIFQEAADDIVLRIVPAGADEAMRWNFHPSQTLTCEPDGSVIVRFHAGGMRELAWHLFAWRDQVQILAPERLKETMREELWLAMVAHLDGAGLAGWIDRAAHVT